MVYIEKLESPSAVRMASRIGASVAMHSTAVGKAFLAGMPPAQRAALLADLVLSALTARTVTTLDALRLQLGAVQTSGWSVDDEENEADIQCFGAAIVGGHGVPVAAISVNTLRFRQKPDPQQAYVGAVLRAALSLPGCDVGFAPPVLRWPSQPAPGWKAPGWPQPQSQPQLRRR